MANLYALKGVGNAGKSSILILLIKELEKAYPNSVKIFENVKFKDKIIILENIKGYRIGIETQGDPGSRLKATLAKFANYQCDIIFCPCRTYGDTVEWINNLSISYNISFVHKDPDKNPTPQKDFALVAHLRQMASI